MFSRTHVLYWSLALFLLLAIVVAIYTQAASKDANASTLGDQNHHAVTFWLQTLDSCRQAISGARFLLEGNGLSLVQESAPTVKPRTVQQDTDCPEEHGNCEAVSVGCMAWHIALPESGQRTYQIMELQAPGGYIPCLGVDSCVAGPAFVTLTLTSKGSVRATTHNSYQNGTVVTLPSSGAPYTGTESNPIVVHNAVPAKKANQPAPSQPTASESRPPATNEGKPPSSSESKPPASNERPPSSSESKPPVQQPRPPVSIPGMPSTGSNPESTH
ncbi:MAG TPA: hypothetical protein VKR06_22955 [Ktedonosporobacter sp.]|nr:hypothetical protein [Ktedonosporobacter sp.]